MPKSRPGRRLFGVVAAVLVVYLGTTFGSAVFPKPTSSYKLGRILSSRELNATFGDTNCTACVIPTFCNIAYVNGNNKCAKCNISNSRERCCEASHNMGVGTSCAFEQGVHPCYGEHDYLEGTIDNQTTCGACSGAGFQRTGDCDDIEDATGMPCNTCPSP